MSDSADDIRKRMQYVRHCATGEVREIVETARTLTDWRYHVRHHPWICAGAALALGFLVVPRKRHVRSEDAQELAALLKKYNVGVSAPQESSKGMFKTMIGAAIPVLARGALHMAQQRWAATGGFSPPPAGRAEPEFEHFDGPR